MKISVENSKANRESLNRQDQQMTLKLVSTSGRSKVISSIAITLNFEFNSECRRKQQFLFHCNASMLQGQLILIWTCCKRNLLTIIVMSSQANICQILGKVSWSSLYWKKNRQKDMWSGRRLTITQTRKWFRSGILHPRRIPKQCLVEKWNPMKSTRQRAES